MIRSIVSALIEIAVSCRTPPVRVRVDDRIGVMRGYDVNELGGWAAVDFGDHYPGWFPADQVTLIGQDT